jgi:hypothetical protein
VAKIPRLSRKSAASWSTITSRTLNCTPADRR